MIFRDFYFTLLYFRQFKDRTIFCYNPLSSPHPAVQDGDPSEEGSHPPAERPEPPHHQERDRRQRRWGAAGRHLHRGKEVSRSATEQEKNESGPFFYIQKSIL